MKSQLLTLLLGGCLISFTACDKDPTPDTGYTYLDMDVVNESDESLTLSLEGYETTADGTEDDIDLAGLFVSANDQGRVEWVYGQYFVASFYWNRGEVICTHEEPLDDEQLCRAYFGAGNMPLVECEGINTPSATFDCETGFYVP